MAEDVMIRIFLRAIERAKLAVNVTNVRVVDVPIDDVCDHLGAAFIIARLFRAISPRVRERAQLLQRKAIQLERFTGRDPLAGEDLVG